MATSGSETYNAGKGVVYTLSWTVKSSSAANNRYVLNVTLKMQVTTGQSGQSAYIGTLFTWQYPTTNTNYSFGEVNFTKDQMTKTVSSSVETYTRTTTLTIDGANVTGNAAAYAGSISVWCYPETWGADYAFTLPYLTVNPNALTRRSDPTVPSSITLGTNFTVTTNRISSGFTHTLQLKAGTRTSFTNLATAIGASKTDCNASISSWASYITTDSSVTGTLRLITYESSQQVGYIDKTVTVVVPSSLTPSITTPTVSDTNGYFDRFGAFLSGASKLHLTWTETISYGSAITSRSVNLFGIAATVQNASATGCDVVISNIATNTGTAAVTVTDGRSRSATGTTEQFKIQTYNKPVVGNSVVYRSDENGDSSLNGDHISVRIPWSKSSVPDSSSNEQNFVKIIVKIDGTLLTTYGSDTVDAPNNQILVLPGTYADTNNYEVELTVQDTVGQSSKYVTSIASVSRPLSVRAYMDSETGIKTWGMAIGKVSEIPDALEIDVITHFYKTIYTSANIIVNDSEGTVGVTPSSQISGHGFFIKDSTGVNLGWLRSRYYTNGNTGLYLETTRKVNGTSVYHSLRLSLDASGNAVVGIAGTGAAASWRAAIDAVNKAGDTMTGALVMNNADIDVRSSSLTVGSTPSANTYGRQIFLRDSAGTTIGYLQPWINTSGNIYVNLNAYRYVNGTNVYNGITLGVNSSGTRLVSVSDPAAWRTALNLDDRYVNISGDTMTGNLIIDKDQPQTYYSSTTMDTEVGQSVPSSGEVMLGGIMFRDKQGYNNGWIRVFKNSSDRVYLYSTVRRNINGSAILNYLQLGITNTGARTVNLSAPAEWRAAISAKNVKLLSKNWDNITINKGSTYTLDQSLSESGWTIIGVIGFWVTNASSSGQGSSYCYVLGAEYTTQGHAHAYIKFPANADTTGYTSAKVRLYLTLLCIQ